MEMKYILDEVDHKKKAGKESWIYKFIPLDPTYKKHVKFNIIVDDKLDTMGDLMLPEDINDIIAFDAKKKNVQGKPPKGDKKAVE